MKFLRVFFAVAFIGIAILVLTYLLLNFRGMQMRFNTPEAITLGDNDPQFPELPEIKGDYIWIPRLGVEAPLIIKANSDNENMLDDLKRGVVHYPLSKLPGQKGTMVVAGHSSQLPWADGDYNNVFSTLELLQEGEEIFVFYNNKQIRYEVIGLEVIAADDWSIFQEDDSLNRLGLLTCWPLGTTAKRLIVWADLAF